jgi:predicted dehydrogenase
MDLAEADRMVEAAAISDRIVGVALVHRYLPAYYVLRDLVRSGAIGRVRQVRLSLGWNIYEDSRFRTPEEDPRAWLVDQSVAGGGILMSSSIHFLSVVSFLLDNGVARRVSATVRRLHPRAFPGIEDDVDLRMELDNGTEFLMQDSWVIDRPYRTEFLGESGQFRATGQDWRNIAIEGVCQGPVPEDYAGYLRGTDFRAPKPRSKTAVKVRFDGLIADFVESVKQGTHSETLPGIEHARNMQAVIDAAYRSGRTGAVQTVDWRFQRSGELR